MHELGGEVMNDISKSALETTIEEWIVGRNAERDREILKRRLIDGLTQEALAEEFDMSTRQIQRILYKEEEIIFRHI